VSGPPERIAPWRERLHEVIFEADTRPGRLFDLALFVAILLSVTAVVLESVESIRTTHGTLLRAFEWAFTVLFTAEYVLRLATVRRPLRYALSFFGVVDLLAVLPTYLGLFFVGAQSLLVIRVLRLLRIFRVLKLVQFITEANLLVRAMRASGRKIIVFLGAVVTLTLVLGTAMYLVEGPQHGFRNIPESVYWAIVTLTTVGYGDIAPETVPGRVLASLVMILGFAIIAVPTGIVTAEISRAVRKTEVTTQSCPECLKEGHDPDAVHCKYCGTAL
jgi:voltage-gated potassium channel